MKHLLAKFVPNKTLGLYIDEHEVTVSLVVGTPLGVIEIASRKESYTANELPSVLKSLLQPLLGGDLGGARGRAYPVVLGLPAVRVFFSTRPIRNTKNDVSPQILLHEALQAPNNSVDDMVVDVLKTRPGKRPVVSLVSCRTKYLAHLLGVLEGCHLQPPRAEPALCALLRAGVYHYKSPRRAKVVVRLFLGHNQGLGMVAVDNAPVIWRFFDLRPGEECQALHSVIRTLQALIKPCGIDLPVEAVLVHGTGALRQQVEADEFQTALALRVLWCEGPGLENSAMAFGLALSGLNAAPEALDLARSLKPPPSLRSIFPWKEIGLQVMLLVGMAAYLADRTQNLHEDSMKVQAEIQRHPWVGSASLTKLEQEKNDLEKKVEAFRTFLASRVLWSFYTNDISARLPANISLNSMNGTFEMETVAAKGASVKGASAKVKKSFVVRATAPLGANGATPPEIDEFLGSLRGHPLLQRDFPLIELADIKATRAVANSQASATFTVVCLPKVAKVSAKADADGKGGAKAKK